MKYLCCSDIHLRGTAPVFRKDNYVETMFRKLEFLVNAANDNEAKLLIAGDIFDTSKVPHEIVNKTMALFFKCNLPVVVAGGQHDQSYHSPNMEKSPLHTLHLAGAVQWQHDEEIYSVDWDQDEVREFGKILLIHKTITPEVPPFFLKTAISAQDAMDMYSDFEWIISGDYHPTHITENDRGQILINCGCMLRNAKDQKQHKPMAHLVDTDYDTYSSIEIPHKPYAEVFDLRLIDLSKKKNFKEALEALSTAMVAGYQGEDFKELVQYVANVQGLSSEEYLLMNEVLLEARC